MIPTKNSQVKESARTGFWVIRDLEYTEASPLTLAANTRVKYNIGNGGALGVGYELEERFAPIGIGADNIWDFSSQKFTPLNIGDTYNFRFVCKALPNQANRDLFIQLDITNNVFPINTSKKLIRGTSMPTPVNVPNDIYCLELFKAQGGEIYLECNTGVDLYDFELFIELIKNNS